jgi:uncharacterized protein YceK
MTLQQYAYLAEIVGLFLIIASLVYVGRQLHQNTEMVRAESRNSIQQNHQQEILTLATFPEIWRGFTLEEMPDQEIRVNMWLTSSIRSREYEWIQYQNGALDRKSWEAFSKAIPLVLSSAKAKSWWNATKPIYDLEFSKVVDELLSNYDFHHVHRDQVNALTIQDPE